MTLAQLVTFNLAQLVTFKNPKLGSVNHFTAYIYVAIDLSCPTFTFSKPFCPCVWAKKRQNQIGEILAKFLFFKSEWVLQIHFPPGEQLPQR